MLTLSHGQFIDFFSPGPVPIFLKHNCFRLLRYSFPYNSGDCSTMGYFVNEDCVKTVVLWLFKTLSLNHTFAIIFSLLIIIFFFKFKSILKSEFFEIHICVIDWPDCALYFMTIFNLHQLKREADWILNFII